MKLLKHVALWPVMAGLLFAPAMAEVTKLNMVAPKEDFPRVWRDPEAMGPDYARTGTSRSIAQMRRVAIGNSKQQLVNAVGRPVSTGKDGTWDFNIALPLTKGSRLVCQYRVYFDDKGRVAGTAWRRASCANIIIRN